MMLLGIKESPEIKVVESDKNGLGEDSVTPRHRLKLHMGNVLLDILDSIDDECLVVPIVETVYLFNHHSTPGVEQLLR